MSSIETGEGYIRHFNREHPEVAIGSQYAAPTAAMDVPERTEDCVLSEDRPAIDEAAPAPAAGQFVMDPRTGVRWLFGDHLEGVHTIIDREFNNVWRKGADGKFYRASEVELLGLKASGGFGSVVDAADVLWSKGADGMWFPKELRKAAIVTINPPSAPGGAGDYIPCELFRNKSPAAPAAPAIDASAFAADWKEKIDQAFIDEPPLLKQMDAVFPRGAWLNGSIERADAVFPRGAELNKTCDCHTKVNQVCDKCCGGGTTERCDTGAEWPGRLLTEDEWLGRKHRPDARKGAAYFADGLENLSSMNYQYPEQGRITLVDLGNGVSINPRYVMAVEGGGLATAAGVRDGVSVIMTNGHQYRFDTPLQHPQAPYRTLSGQERADIAELTRRRILELLGSPGYYATELAMPSAELVSPGAEVPFYTN